MVFMVSLTCHSNRSVLLVGLWVLNTPDTWIHCALDGLTLGKLAKEDSPWSDYLQGHSAGFLPCPAFSCNYSSGPCPWPTSFFSPWHFVCGPWTISFTPAASTAIFSLMNPQFLLQVRDYKLVRDLSCKLQRLTQAKCKLSKIYRVAPRIFAKLKKQNLANGLEEREAKVKQCHESRRVPAVPSTGYHSLHYQGPFFLESGCVAACRMKTPLSLFLFFFLF